MSKASSYSFPKPAVTDGSLIYLLEVQGFEEKEGAFLPIGEKSLQVVGLTGQCGDEAMGQCVNEAMSQCGDGAMSQCGDEKMGEFGEELRVELRNEFGHRLRDGVGTNQVR
jgi:hypothetical protein